ncbi:MAG TPA: hypothetical protein P5538_05610 [Bacteroidales bacterium]|nr:hypothetical protein [Bacteroidales bacterium]HOL98377.1 hypothetical protein [Bacteroidales bacterium]HOM37269.1 hypothetical protein [Bacteroidales bacterium]HPD24624.1 hypothetical protein [Bacteroidales bacterium]HRS99546.1 hypothetical protein [Bacteroidales bacterium]
MKKFILFSILVFVFSQGFMQAQNIKQKHVRKFCKEFASLVQNGDIDNTIRFFDEEYLQLQLYGMLKSNKIQFVEEFLAGYTNDRSFVVPSIKEIEKVSVKEIEQLEEDEFKVNLTIYLYDGKIISTPIIVKAFSNKKMVLLGAVG